VEALNNTIITTKIET